MELELLQSPSCVTNALTKRSPENFGGNVHIIMFHYLGSSMQAGN